MFVRNRRIVHETTAELAARLAQANSVWSIMGIFVGSVCIGAGVTWTLLQIFADPAHSAPPAVPKVSTTQLLERLWDAEDVIREHHAMLIKLQSRVETLERRP